MNPHNVSNTRFFKLHLLLHTISNTKWRVIWTSGLHGTRQREEQEISAQILCHKRSVGRKKLIIHLVEHLNETHIEKLDDIIWVWILGGL